MYVHNKAIIVNSSTIDMLFDQLKTVLLRSFHPRLQRRVVKTLFIILSNSRSVNEKSTTTESDLLRTRINSHD